MQEKIILPDIGATNTILFGCIVGSQAYGTNLPGSDVDKRWVYVQSSDDLFINGYVPQININKDEVVYEIGRVLELAEKANPTILELLFVPEDCIVYKHPAFDKLLSMRRDFLTKQCRFSFGGYAVDQIEKAQNLEKKINWEKEITDRKSVLDFCYFISKVDSKFIGAKFQSHPIKQKFELFEIYRMGLSALSHAKDFYNLFWDSRYQLQGVCIGENIATDIRLSDIPSDAACLGLMYFNKDAYSTHCKHHNEYITWLKNRNEQRYVDVKAHGQKMDGKNMLHCIRSIETALDIAEKGDLIVRRENSDYLNQIRKGYHSLAYILAVATDRMDKMKEAFKKCNLPESFENDNIMKMIVYQIRRQVAAEYKKNPASFQTY